MKKHHSEQIQLFHPIIPYKYFFYILTDVEPCSKGNAVQETIIIIIAIIITIIIIIICNPWLACLVSEAPSPSNGP